MVGLPFPDIDPVALYLWGGFGIRWYALAYLAGILLGWSYAGYLADLDRDRRPNRADIDNLIPLIVLVGIIVGGRLGYVLFYNFGYYLNNPAEILRVWEGGMSFHGGLAGVAIVCAVYAWRNKISLLALGDIFATVAPIGIFFGRIANFINGELYGRVSTLPWAIQFPHGGHLPRHPSQLYEALLEGLLLCAVLYFAARKPSIRRTPGVLLGIFIAGYGIGRFIVEFFREPDVQIGLLMDYFTMGQLLSLPMIALGAYLIFHARKPARSAK